MSDDVKEPEVIPADVSPSGIQKWWLSYMVDNDTSAGVIIVEANNVTAALARVHELGIRPDDAECTPLSFRYRDVPRSHLDRLLTKAECEEVVPVIGVALVKEGLFEGMLLTSDDVGDIAAPLAECKPKQLDPTTIDMLQTRNTPVDNIIAGVRSRLDVMPFFNIDDQRGKPFELTDEVRADARAIVGRTLTPAAFEPLPDQAAVVTSQVTYLGTSVAVEDLHPRGTPEQQEFYDWYEDRAWMCGCGSPAEVLAFVLDVLEYYSLPHGERIPAAYERFPDPAHEFVLHILEDEELLEHGSTAHGGWCTPEGKARARQIRLWGPMMVHNDEAVRFAWAPTTQEEVDEREKRREEKRW